jgi:hypothetical protein
VQPHAGDTWRRVIEGTLRLGAGKVTTVLADRYIPPPGEVTDQFIALKALWTHCGIRLVNEGVVTTSCRR